jgi:hypothetical protein
MGPEGFTKFRALLLAISFFCGTIEKSLKYDFDHLVRV